MNWLIFLAGGLMAACLYGEIVREIRKQQEKSDDLAVEIKEVQEVLREIRDLLENIDDNTGPLDTDNDY